VQCSRQVESEDELNAARQVQLRILGAALPTCQTRPDRGLRSRRQELLRPVRTKGALPGEERKVPMLSRVVPRAEEHPRRVRMVKVSHNTRRKKAKRPHRLVRNNFSLVILAAPGKIRGCFFERVFCRASVSDANL